MNIAASGAGRSRAEARDLLWNVKTSATRWRIRGYTESKFVESSPVEWMRPDGSEGLGFRSLCLE